MSRKSETPRPRRTRAAHLIAKEKLLNAGAEDVSAKMLDVESMLRLLVSTEELNRRTRALNVKREEAAATEAIHVARAEAHVSEYASGPLKKRLAFFALSKCAR
ncbi:MAG: hypothetical protein LH632_14485, partial [Rhodoferax sp.]|nr:hypothetical protein [Rhodoferax sp.]